MQEPVQRRAAHLDPEGAHSRAEHCRVMPQARDQRHHLRQVAVALWRHGTERREAVAVVGGGERAAEADYCTSHNERNHTDLRSPKTAAMPPTMPDKAIKKTCHDMKEKPSRYEEAMIAGMTKPKPISMTLRAV